MGFLGFFFVVLFYFYIIIIFPMFTVCERGSSRRGRGINDSGLYWIIKSELLAACVIISHVPVHFGDLQKFTCFLRTFLCVCDFFLELVYSHLCHLSVVVHVGTKFKCWTLGEQSDGRAWTMSLHFPLLYLNHKTLFCPFKLVTCIL